MIVFVRHRGEELKETAAQEGVKPLMQYMSIALIAEYVFGLWLED